MKQVKRTIDEIKANPRLSEIKKGYEWCLAKGHNPEDLTGDKLLVAIVRAHNPKARCESKFVIGNNGSSSRDHECVWCGMRGPSWCAGYPQTKYAKDWERNHDCTPAHVRAFVAGLKAGFEAGFIRAEDDAVEAA